MLTLEEYREIKEKMDEAQEDDTPYATVTDDELHILGNPNNTKTKSHEYTVGFAFPRTKEWEKSVGEENILKKTDNYIYMERKFEDVFITPRMQAAVVSSFVEFYAFFQKINADGSVEEPTLDEIRVILRELSGELEAAMYNAVGKVLGVKEELIDFMIIGDVVKTCLKLIGDFPEIVNEADLFFG